MAKPKFEKSKFDNDSGVKEGSKKDLARDVKERALQRRAGAKQKEKARSG